MRWRPPQRSSFTQLKHAATVRRGPLVVSFASVPGAEPAMLAFAISKKVGNAVTRNRLRRRLREVVRLHVGLEAGIYLVRARPEAAQMGFDELRAQTVEAFAALARTARRPPPAPVR